MGLRSRLEGDGWAGAAAVAAPAGDRRDRGRPGVTRRSRVPAVRRVEW